MSIISRLKTWTAELLTYSDLNAEFNNITNLLNNLDAATTTWTNVKVTTLAPLANVAMSSFKLTGLAAGSSNGDSVRYEQLPAVSGTITNWTTYTPTMGGFGTTTGAAYWRRMGDTLEVRGIMTAATFSATNVSITLPNSVTIDDTKTRSAITGQSQVGYGSTLAAAGVSNSAALFYDGADTAKVYASNDATAAGPSFNKRTASNWYGAATPTTLTFMFAVPISTWTI